MRDDQGWWYFLFAVFFVGAALFLMYILFSLHRLPTGVSLFDITLIILATFRFTRLFVYDKITQFIRDWFLRKEVVLSENGAPVIIRGKLVSGPGRTVYELISCPWCFGLWAALLVSFFFFLTELAYFPILILAIAGVASFLQLLSNLTGWRAELYKKEVENI